MLLLLLLLPLKPPSPYLEFEFENCCDDVLLFTTVGFRPVRVTAGALVRGAMKSEEDVAGEEENEEAGAA